MPDELDKLIAWARTNLLLLLVFGVLLLVVLALARAVFWAFGFEICIVAFLLAVVILLLSRR